MRSRIFTLLSLSICFSGTLVAQNLVSNGGFEEYTHCPSKIVNFSGILKEISLPTASSGDYFNTCGSDDFDAPLNFRGTQEPAEGKGYAGLYFYALNDYREYAQLNTTKTLRDKYPYKFSFQVSLAETSTISLKNMAVVVTNTKVRVPNSQALTSSRMDLLDGVDYRIIPLKADKSLSDKDEWVTMTAEFDARGYENHILIVNFSNNSGTNVINGNKSIVPNDFAYYYVDNVVLEELPRVNYEQDKIYVLEESPFQPKGYELDAEAIASVKKIFKFLKENAEVQMKITGHSNDAGDPAYNKFVSSLRARAVALYLKKLGIDDSRLVWEGVGESKNLGKTKVAEKPQVEFVMTNFDNE